MAETMWAITSGSYSDYRVLCLCQSKSDAKRLAARMNAAGGSIDAEIEEFPVVSDPDVKQVETLRMNVDLWDDGSEGEERISYWTEWPFDRWADTRPVQWRWVRAPVHNGRGGRLEVSGTDHKRARKVFSERKALVKNDDAFRSKLEARS